MAYIKFNGQFPDASSQNGASFGQSTRDNQNALRDMILMGGIEGWDMSCADVAFPTKYTFTGTGERIEADATYNTSDQVTQVVFNYFPAPTGGVADLIATVSFVYSSAHGIVTQINWS